MRVRARVRVRVTVRVRVRVRVRVSAMSKLYARALTPPGMRAPRPSKGCPRARSPPASWPR